MGLPILDGDEAFYFLNKVDNLQGAVITHVDDFNRAGIEEFLRR